MAVVLNIVVVVVVAVAVAVVVVDPDRVPSLMYNVHKSAIQNSQHGIADITGRPRCLELSNQCIQ
jgi:hypothetical protein